MRKEEDPYRRGISVVIPVYNAEKTLVACLESVLAQELSMPLEVVLVDDGSTDSSGDICDEYAAKTLPDDIRIIVSHGRNLGVSHARNTGMDMAGYEFLTFVDADDTLTTDCLKQLLDAMLLNNALMAGESDRIYAPYPISGFDYVEHGVLNGDTHVWAKVYRHAYLENKLLRFPEDLTIGEDMIFLLGLSLIIGHASRVVLIPRGGYRYMDNPQGAMKRRFMSSYLDQVYCWQRALHMMQPFAPELPDSAFTELSVIRVMAAMLVIGKVAVLPIRSWNDKGAKQALKICREEIRACIWRRGTYLGLPFDYKLKVLFVRLFGMRQYLFAYKWSKSRGKRRGMG